ncbi:MAG: hypothetical protein ICV78_20420, partial [Tolypothrix sp. Co-bin9]|nr:hypothetical protein [Tolypothrix sp. Co-bin9]
KLNYAVSGGSIGYGPAFEQPHIWSFNAYCSLQQQRILGAMYFESDYCRRNGGNHEILLMDMIEEYQERSPRTRPIVPFTNEVIVGINHVSYFSQFLVWFTQKPEFSKSGSKYIANISLQETRKLQLQ